MEAVLSLVDQGNLFIIIRILVYLIALIVVAVTVYIVDSPQGNGGRYGLRFILVPLFVTHMTYVLSTTLKLCGVSSVYTPWLFTMSSLVTVGFMVALLLWLYRER